MNELQAITDFIDDQIDRDETETIWGYTIDDTLGDAVNVTIVATGFDLTSEERYGEETAARFIPKPEPVKEEKPAPVDVGKYYDSNNVRKIKQEPVHAPVETPTVPEVKTQQQKTTVTVTLDGSDELYDTIESQPAYIRKKANVASRSYLDGDISNFSLSNDGDSVEIKDTNSYLHNNVD